MIMMIITMAYCGIVHDGSVNYGVDNKDRNDDENDRDDGDVAM